MSMASPRIGALAFDYPMEQPDTALRVSSSTTRNNISRPPSFHFYLSSATKIHDELTAKSVGLEEENQRLQAELGRMRQNMNIFCETPRPDASTPMPLTPVVLTPRSDAPTMALLQPEAAAPATASGETDVGASAVDDSKRVSFSQEPASTMPIHNDNDDVLRGISGHISNISCNSLYSGDNGERQQTETSGDQGVGTPLTPACSHSSPTFPLSSSTTVQRNELRKMHDIRRKFHRLDREGRGEVKGQWLEELLAKHGKSSIRSDASSNAAKPSCSEVIKIGRFLFPIDFLQASCPILEI